MEKLALAVKEVDPDVVVVIQPPTVPFAQRHRDLGHRHIEGRVSPSFEHRMLP